MAFAFPFTVIDFISLGIGMLFGGPNNCFTTAGVESYTGYDAVVKGLDIVVKKIGMGCFLKLSYIVLFAFSLLFSRGYFLPFQLCCRKMIHRLFEYTFTSLMEREISYICIIYFWGCSQILE